MIQGEALFILLIPVKGGKQSWPWLMKQNQKTNGLRRAEKKVPRMGNLQGRMIPIDNSMST